jgi:rRNA maturation RNase YbeY
MSINFFNEDVDLPKIKKRNTVAWIKQVIDEHCKKVGDVSFIFCSDTYLLDVNKQYLDHDYFTDVITFDYVEGDVVSGDIFISVDRVEENAKSFSTSFSNELNRVIIHGILHLLRYNDKTDTDKLIMTGKEDLYLNLLNNN